MAHLQVPLVNPAILTAHEDRPSGSVDCDRAERHELPGLCESPGQRTRTEVPDPRPVSSPKYLSPIGAKLDLTPDGSAAVTRLGRSCCEVDCHDRPFAVDGKKRTPVQA